MRALLVISVAGLALAACSPGPGDAPEESSVLGAGAETGAPPAQAGPDAAAQAAIAEAIEDASRPEPDRLRDINRHPAEILSFAGVQPGWRIADLGAASGYYSRILSSAVGEDGHVYAFNPAWVAERFSETDAGLQALAADRANMTHASGNIANFPDGMEQPLDAVFMMLFYHDTAWEAEFKTADDRAAMNRAAFDALRPGGVYLIVDHHAEAGTGLSDVGDYHRINAEIVREEVMAAGFELAAESDLLANPEDSRDISVFDPSIRGSTDRFVYLFRKPD